MIGLVLFSRDTLWRLLYPDSRFNYLMVSNIRQEEIDIILKRDFGRKIKLFLFECLQVDYLNRKSCDELLQQYLFRTDSTSTIHGNNLHLTKEAFSQNINELKIMLQQFQEEGQDFVSDLVNGKLSELLLCLQPNQIKSSLK